MRKKQLLNVLAIVSAILAAGLITYFSKYNGPFSAKSEDWGHFAEYIGLYISFASLILIGFVSILTNSINERATEIANSNLEASTRFYKYQMMPILDLSVERSHQDFYPTYPDSWYVMNCSIAAARNILLKFWVGNRESSFILLYSMAEKYKLELPWLRSASKIQLYYSDATCESFYLFEMENMRGAITELSDMQFKDIQQKRYFNIADVVLDFRQKFLDVTGRQLTELEYSDFFETYRKI